MKRKGLTKRQESALHSWRCDLHPTFNAQGDMIVVNAVDEKTNSRTISVLKLNLTAVFS